MRAKLLFFLAAFSAVPAMAAPADTSSCITVRVDGAPSPAYECLNAQLQAAARSAKPMDPNIPMKQVLGDGAPSRLGLATPTAASIRMGSSFGRSATPQRP